MPISSVVLLFMAMLLVVVLFALFVQAPLIEPLLKRLSVRQQL